MTGFDVKRKRPWWFAWIPAFVLVLLIGAVATTVVLVQRSDIGKPLPKPTVGQVTELNWSSFTKEGLAYIDRSRNVRIDLSKPPVDASALGLPDDGTTTIGPTDYGDRDNDYYVIVSGGGEGHGGTKLTVTQLDITTEGGLVTGLAASEIDALPFRNALALLQGEVDEFGWAPIDSAAVFNDWVDTTGAGNRYEFATGAGTRLGFSIVGTVTCEPQSVCAVRYDVAPTVR